MTSTLLVWGAGGHGRVVADAAVASGWRVDGFVDSDPLKAGLAPADGYPPVMLSEVDLRRQFVDGSTASQPVAVGIGDNVLRLTAARELGARLAPPILHPGATVSPTARLAPGSVVFAGAVINSAAWFGYAVIVNSGAVVEHDCRILDGVHISPGAVLAGGVEVGAMTWIGAGAVMIPGIRIGANAVIGAGAVVIRDVPDGATVVGNPARPIRR